MFIRVDNSLFDMYKMIHDFENPKKLMNIEYTMAPNSNIGPTSGAYLLAQYLESINSCIQTSLDKLTDDYIITNLYDPIKISSKNNYIKASDGMEKIALLLGLMEKNVLYTDNTEVLKHFIHKFGTVVVEMVPNSCYCTKEEGDIIPFEIIDNGTIISHSLSKGFLACGYDENGFILFNSLGQSYGSSGFIHISNDVFTKNFIKASAIANIYY